MSSGSLWPGSRWCPRRDSSVLASGFLVRGVIAQLGGGEGTGQREQGFRCLPVGKDVPLLCSLLSFLLSAGSWAWDLAADPRCRVWTRLLTGGINPFQAILGRQARCAGIRWAAILVVSGRAMRDGGGVGWPSTTWVRLTG